MYHRRKQQSLEERLSQMEQMRVFDMHAHLSCLEEDNKKRLSEKEQLVLGRRELDLRRACGVATFFSCGTPEEWGVLERFFADHTGEKAYGSEILRSFGIHPWYSDQYDPMQYRSLFEQCDAVGEIGMDSVWCDAPLQVQQERFVKQLELAAELKKPVILHTKGQEAQIAELVRDFPGKICVHWYSGDEKNFEKFLEMGCYFTLGPDAALCWNRMKQPEKGTENEISANLYQRMLQEIPSDRLFLETDGIWAVAWARGISVQESQTEERGTAEKRGDVLEKCFCPLPLNSISAVLEENLQLAALQKGLQAEELRCQMWQNLRAFLNA